MSVPFINTTRAVSADRSYSNILTIFISLLLLSLWFSWLFLADISTYKKSENAQFKEAKDSAQISTRVLGKVASIHVELGQAVKKGELLFRMDMSLLTARMNGTLETITQLKTSQQAISHERDALRTKHNITIETQQLKIKQLTEEQQSLTHIIEIQSDIANRYKTLLLTQKGAELDYLNAKKTHQEYVIDYQQVSADIENIELNMQSLEQQHQQTLAQLSQRQSVIGQQLNLAQTHYQQQQLETEHYQIRSPSDGIIASLAPIALGQVLTVGEQIATLLTHTNLIIEAQFSPQDALGHIHIGQQARVELKGFARTQYGTLEAEVTQIAGAVQNGHIRVKLSITDTPSNTLPIQHDLPASVEIETGKQRPVDLVLQRTNAWLTPQATDGNAANLGLSH
ncbi:HlyD family efflux transporter periplasmic adaptor subunit [Alteromonadaceae bacterium M269]|nr:HlyD family efflux transporter periplasmic adaptor subunit [Alteromonadaceae bacterium M269]